MPWRWPCEPGNAPAETSRGWSITATQGLNPAIRYTTRLLEAGAVASIGSVGDCDDNAEAESLIGLHKAECVRHDGRSVASMTSSS